MVIQTPDRRLRVFVSSTVGERGELVEERRAVTRAITAMRLTPVLFELGARPHPPQELYRSYVAQSDVSIGLYWQGYGQVDPGMRISGLEEELDLAEGCPACCTSRRRRQTASPAWPACWTASSAKARTPTGTSARPPSSAGWSVTTWRRC